jgi:Tfp pilus assembly protein PilE
MIRPASSRARRAQRGVTLIVALIMLTVLGLLAGWAVKSGTTNLRIVNNTQARQEAFSAAQAALEATISSRNFSTQPQAVADNPIDVDVDGDGTPDMTARITPLPSCYRWRAIKTSELDYAQAADRACMGSSAASTAGLDTGAAAVAGDSLCADSEWNVRAEVVDTATNASVRINQGVSLRGVVTDVINSCP